jgi:hypothetical protein
MQILVYRFLNRHILYLMDKEFTFFDLIKLSIIRILVYIAYNYQFKHNKTQANIHIFVFALIYLDEI